MSLHYFKRPRQTLSLSSQTQESPSIKLYSTRYRMREIASSSYAPKPKWRDSSPIPRPSSPFSSYLLSLTLYRISYRMTRLPLTPPHFPPQLNSYQRLLIHRLADTFGIARQVEPSQNFSPNLPTLVILVKGPNIKLSV